MCEEYIMTLSNFETTYAGAKTNIGDVNIPIFTSDFNGFADDNYTLQFSLIDAQNLVSAGGGFTPYTSYLETDDFGASGFTFGYNSLESQFEFHTIAGDIVSFDASSIDMQSDAPHHFAFSVDEQAGQINLHVDGNDLGGTSLTNGINFSGGGDLVFGQSLTDFSSSNFDNPAFSALAGATILQDIVVYNEIRSDIDIMLDAKYGEAPDVASPTLSHQWDFTVADAEAITDQVTGATTTLNPATIVEGDRAATPADTGIELNLVSETNNDMIIIENFDGFSNTAFTLQVDFASTTQLAEQSFIGLASYAEHDSDNSLLIGMRDGGSFQIFAEGIGYVEYPYDLNALMDGGQHTLSVSVDPDNNIISMYVDGRSLGDLEFEGELSIEGGGTLVFGQEQDFMGGGFDAEQAFEGTITQGLVYNELRADEDIQQDALSGDVDLENSTLTSAWDFEPNESGNVTDLVGLANGLTVSEALGTTLAEEILPDYGRGLTLNTENNTGQYAAVTDFDGFTSDSFTLDMSFASVMNIGSDFKALVSYAEPGYDNAFTIGTNHGGSVIEVHARSIGVVSFELDAWGIMDGNEHNLAVSIDNDTLEMSLYVDGVLLGTEAMSEAMTINGGGTLLFGQEQDLMGGGFDVDQAFEGTYFGASLFQDVRTAEEIAQTNETGITGSEDNLYANWTFEEDGVVDSISGNDMSITLDALQAVEVDSVEGGIALNLEQTDQHLEITNYQGLDADQTTIEMSFSSTMDLAGNFKPLFSYSEPGHDNALTFGFAHNGSGLQVHLKGQQPITFGVDGAGLMDGASHEVALTIDNVTGEMGLYVDGALVGHLPIEDLNLSGNGIIVLGQEQDSYGGGFSDNQIFQGMVHELRIFDEVRSSEEIYNDAANGVDTVAESNIVSQWDMRLGTDLTIDDLTGNQSLTAFNFEAPTEALPEFGQVELFDLNEGVGAGTVVAQVTASDANWDSLSFALVDDHEGTFVIDATTGEISVADGHVLDADDQENYSLNVDVLENGVSVGVTQDITISVNDEKDTINVEAADYVNYGDAGDTLLGSALDDNSITGDTGNNLILGDNDALTSSAGGNDTLNGHAGNDDIYGQGGDDVLIGGTGDDYLEGNEGNDQIFGSAGTDSVRFYGAIEDFTITYDQDNDLFSLQDMAGNEGSDTVTGVENFIFDDGTTQTRLSANALKEYIEVAETGSTSSNVINAQLIGEVPAVGTGTGFEVTIYNSNVTMTNVHTVEDWIDSGALSATHQGNASSLSFTHSNGTLGNFFADNAMITPLGNNRDIAYLGMNNVAMKFEGYIYIEPGEHELSVKSDDGFLLKINGEEFSSFSSTRAYTATSETAEFEGGLYQVELIYYDNTHANGLSLEIDGQEVPAEHLFLSTEDYLNVTNTDNEESEAAEGAATDGPRLGSDFVMTDGVEGTGLVGTFYNKDTYFYTANAVEDEIAAGLEPTTVVDVDTIDFRSGGASTVSDFIGYAGNKTEIVSGDANLRMEYVGLHIEGYIYIPPGEHSFAVASDDGFRLDFDGETFTQHQQARGFLSTSETGTFEGGLYKLDLYYYENWGGEGVRLTMDGEVIPSHYFFKTVEDFETVVNNETIFGTDNADTIDANIGNDIVHAGAGDDAVEGGEGQDLIFGEDGNDNLYGNGGNDEISGGAGSDIIVAGEGDDIVAGDDGNDSLYGGYGDDVITGGEGNDRIYGGEDEDSLSGGAGNDVISGGTGDDNINGGAGMDTLVGNQGSDVFEVSGAIEENGTKIYGGHANGTQNEEYWTDIVTMDIEDVTGLLYSAGDIDSTDGYLELTNGSMTISVDAGESPVSFDYDDASGIATISLETNTDAVMSVDLDNDGTYDTTYNLYDIESISLT